MARDLLASMPPLPPDIPERVFHVTDPPYDTYAVTKHEAAKLLGVTVKYIQRFIEEGKLAVCFDAEVRPVTRYVLADALWALVPEHLRDGR